MSIHDYQAKEIINAIGIPMPCGLMTFTTGQVEFDKVSGHKKTVSSKYENGFRADFSLYRGCGSGRQNPSDSKIRSSRDDPILLLLALNGKRCVRKSPLSRTTGQWAFLQFVAYPYLRFLILLRPKVAARPPHRRSNVEGSGTVVPCSIVTAGPTVTPNRLAY
jgi:hypothetical protein